MIKKEETLDDDGNVIEEKITQKREPASSEQPSAVTVADVQEFASTALAQTPISQPDNYVMAPNQAGQVQQLPVQTGPANPTGQVPTQAAPIQPREAAPIDRTKIPQQQVQSVDMPDLPKTEGSDFGLSTSAKAISDMGQIPEQIKQSDDEINKVLKDKATKEKEIAEKYAVKAASIVGPSQNSKDEVLGKRSLGQRLTEGLFVFLGGVGLKPGQENQVFSYYTKRALAQIEKEAKIKAAKSNISLSPKELAYAQRMEMKNVFDDAKLRLDAIAKKQGMSLNLQKSYDMIADASLEMNKQMQQIVMDEFDVAKESRKDFRETGLEVGKLYRSGEVQKMGEKAKKLEVKIPSVPNASTMAASEEDAKELKSQTTGYNLYLDYVRQILDLRKKFKSSGLGPTEFTKSLGYTDLQGMRNFMKSRVITVGQSIVNTGVLSGKERDTFLDELPFDFMEYGEGFVGKIKAMNQFMEAKFQQELDTKLGDGRFKTNQFISTTGRKLFQINKAKK